MDYTSQIAELLARHGFRRFRMSRTQVGHLKLLGHAPYTSLRSSGSTCGKTCAQCAGESCQSARNSPPNTAR